MAIEFKLTKDENEEYSEVLDEINRLKNEQNEIVLRQREIQIQIRKNRDKLHDLRLEQERKEKQKKLEEEKEQLKEQERLNKLALEEAYSRILELDINSWDPAREFQREDIITMFHAYRQGERAFFNANDMGLGKTFESGAMIEILLKENPNWKCLWLTKSSILETGGSEREIKKWTDLPVVSFRGNMPKEQRDFVFETMASQKGVIVITNYEAVRTTPALANSKYDLVIMDEVHKLKGGANTNGPTATWRAIREFLWDFDMNGKVILNATPKFKFLLPLSGTPMVNRVAELWAYLHLFDPIKFYSLKEFERAFNAYKEVGGNVQVDRILDICLRGRMLRRTRSEVGLQLPPIQDIDVEIKYSDKQQEVYDQMKKQFFIWLEGQDDKVLSAAAIIAQLTRLRQISVWPVFSQEIKGTDGEVIDVNTISIEESAKIDETMDIIEGAVGQVVVFCNFNEPFEEIERRCRRDNLTVAKITGKTRVQMGSIETDFQQGKIDVLCINSSMGEGLNLQKNIEFWPGGATTAIFLDEWWTPDRDGVSIPEMDFYSQCVSRIYRQGAIEPVFIYRMHNPNSVDAFVRATASEKREIFTGITEDSAIRPAYQWKSEMKKYLG